MTAPSRALASQRALTSERAFAYQPALDGLRALAVASVMLYHGAVPWLPGGFLGVDVFFVLSGYLITNLLWREAQANGRIRLLAFWGRRLRRLLPALLGVLLGIAACAEWLVEPGRLDRLRGDGLSALLYVSNWRFILNEQSYFDQFAAPSPVLHTWSLGIEEQWYLIWPLVLWALLGFTKGKARRMGIAIALAALVSAAWMAWLYEPGQDPSRVYYGTDTRAQNLLIGSALAFALPLIASRERLTRWIGPVGALGVVALAALLFLANDQSTWLYRGGLLVSAVATAALIAAAVQPAGALRAALSASPLRFIGRISYGMYLWHWPLYLLLTSERTGIDGPLLLAARVAATLAVATLSFYLVESPIRGGAFTGRRAGGLALAGVAGTAAALFVATQPTPLDGLAQPQSVEQIAPDAANGPKRKILVLGDSVAHSLAGAFPHYKYDGSLEIVNRATVGCGIGTGHYAYGGGVFESGPECQDWPSRWQPTDSLDAALVIVLVGAWEVVDRVVAGERFRVHGEEYARYIQTEMLRGLAPFLERGTRVVLLTTPCFSQRWGATNSVRPAPQDERRDPTRVLWLNQALAGIAAARPSAIELVDLHAYSCSPENLPRSIDGVELQPDGVHFERRGGRRVWSWLLPRIGVTQAGDLRPDRG